MTAQDSASDNKPPLLKYTPDAPLPEGVELYCDEQKLYLHVKFLNGDSDAGNGSAVAEDLLKVLNDIGVLGLDTGAVATAAGQNSGGEPVLIASGRPPKHGEDGKIEYKFDSERAGKVNLSEDEFGRVDFRELDAITHVKEGDVIAEIIEPTEGEPGQDVFGQPVPAQPGKPVPYKSRFGQNVALEEDGRTVIAKVTGLVTVEKDKLVVSALYKTGGDVDFETGNIKFDGDVLINGFVRENFRVEATGSVQVVKNIERATVIAGTDVCVDGGIIGKEGVEVVAGQKIVTSYTRNASLKASDSITIEKEMVHSVARAPRVFVHAGRGVVLGGEIHATEYIKVTSAGDPDSCVKTIVDIEYDPEIIRQIKARQERLVVVGKKCTEAKTVLEQFSVLAKRQAHGLSKFALGKMETIRELMHKVGEEQTELNLEIAALEEQLQRPSDVKIVVQDKLYPGSQLFILGTVHDVVEPMQGGTFKLVGGVVKQVRSR